MISEKALASLCQFHNQRLETEPLTSVHGPSTHKAQQQKDCKFKAGLFHVAKPHGKGK